MRLNLHHRVSWSIANMLLLLLVVKASLRMTGQHIQLDLPRKAADNLFLRSVWWQFTTLFELSGCH